MTLVLWYFLYKGTNMNEFDSGVKLYDSSFRYIYQWTSVQLLTVTIFCFHAILGKENLNIQLLSVDEDLLNPRTRKWDSFLINHKKKYGYYTKTTVNDMYRSCTEWCFITIFLQSSLDKIMILLIKHVYYCYRLVR